MTPRFEAFDGTAAAAAGDLPMRAVRSDGLELLHPEWSPAALRRITEALEDAGASLRTLGAREIIRRLGAVGACFLDPGDPLRAEALELLPPASGLSREMARWVLDGMARDWTEARLLRLVETELEHPRALDRFVTVRGRRAMAVGPRLTVQILAGSVPGVGVTALLRSLLLKSPTLLKPGRGDVVLPVLFARALRASSPDMAAALAVAYWPGGASDVEDAALGAGEVVTAYGSDETVRLLRARLPATTRFVGYHHRVSVGVVGAAALAPGSVDGTAREVAEAVAAFDQRGCVCPQVVYVEESGETGPEEFGRRLALALSGLEARLPGGTLDVEEAAALHQLRGTAEVLAGTGAAQLHHGGAGATWTVVVEREAAPGLPCVGRVVRLRPLAHVARLPALLAPLDGHLQTLAVAGLGEATEAVAEACAAVGVSRVAPFSGVAFPPPWWYHDGRGPLTELVRWVELEG